MPQARLAVSSDLEPLLELFAQANVSPHVTPIERAREIWASTLAQQGNFVFVSNAGSKIAATCMLITAPNLLREGRKHGFIENVVTHADFKRRGHGSAVIRTALDTAWAEDCHHVLLQSGRTNPGVHRFYEVCGFEPGVRTAYVAKRPVAC